MRPDQSAADDRGLTPEDRLRINHMLRCSTDARVIVGNDDANELTRDMVRTRALVNCFTEIGEAAARLSVRGRGCIKAVPWPQIIGMRNIVVHVYWSIDVAELVKTTREDLPTLIAALEAALAAWPSPPSSNG
jgi:uncharacterized protein with HEPN domain